MALPERLPATLLANGQVILPKTIRDLRHWEPGTRLVVENAVDGVLLKAATVFAPTRPEDVFASLPRKGAPKTLAEMKVGIVRRDRQ